MSEQNDQPAANPPAPGRSVDVEKGSAVTGSGSGAPGDGKRTLTPEEQMAAYEEALKEDDWGHQPC